MMYFKKTTLVISILFISFNSCNEKKQTEKVPKTEIKDVNKILTNMQEAYGSWENLWNKKDVSYNYSYKLVSGKEDFSTERYIFDTETSFGHYLKHEVNTMPNKKGVVTHLFHNSKTVLTLDGKNIIDKKNIEVSQFLRRANYFWFVMPYKLNDPGTIAKYLGTETHNNTKYNKIEISYKPETTGKVRNDIYIIFVNETTKMIDKFYFSLPFFGIKDPVILAEYTYETLENQKISVDRIYFLPNKEGKYSKEPTIVQKLTNIKFNNNFTQDNISKIN